MKGKSRMSTKSPNIKTVGAWRPVLFDPTPIDKDMIANLSCFEELTDYQVASDGVCNQSDDAKQGDDMSSKTKKRKLKETVKESHSHGNEHERKKKKTHRKNSPIKGCTEDLASQKEEYSPKIDENPSRVQRKSLKQNLPRCDMSAWHNHYVPQEVLRALADIVFLKPTAIQSACLPPAVRDRLDIIGAAETGSGKTLAFGIPVIHRILETRSDSGSTSNSKEPMIQLDEVVSPEDIQDDAKAPTGKEQLQSNGVVALILTPTRELAVQVCNHIRSVAKYTSIKVATIVGGMAQEKQERVLKRRPEIVVATPGRLWELIQAGNPHLSDLRTIKCLVVDEADRMIEKGHFEEMSNILAMINEDGTNSKQRQTFVFSATLTLVHKTPKRHALKKKHTTLTQKGKLDSMISTIGIKEKARVIDLTRQFGTAENLIEARINCAKEEKDLYLYYILLHYPGRTLVFANSKDCIRRMVSICTLLKRSPLPLHADMHQKQRLKNLERFAADPCGLLLATDVAARGLDIPDVQHVIHYQVPRTSESYVHRSGRTARASKEGVTIMFVSEQEAQFYRRHCRNLARSDDLPLFPVDDGYLTSIREHLHLATELDKLEHKQRKANSSRNWLQRAAQEMDIDIDEELVPASPDQQQLAAELRQLKLLKKQLSSLLSKKILPKQYSQHYPTSFGELRLPQATGTRQGTAGDVLRENKTKKKHRQHSVLKQHGVISSKTKKRKPRSKGLHWKVTDT